MWRVYISFKEVLPLHVEHHRRWGGATYLSINDRYLNKSFHVSSIKDDKPRDSTKIS